MTTTPQQGSTMGDLVERLQSQCRWCGRPKSEHLDNEIHPRHPICPQEPRKHDYFAHWPDEILDALSSLTRPVCSEGLVERACDAIGEVDLEILVEAYMPGLARRQLAECILAALTRKEGADG